MRQINLDEYKYLDVLQLDSIVNTEVKEKAKGEYIGRVKMLLRLPLNEGECMSSGYY